MRSMQAQRNPCFIGSPLGKRDYRFGTANVNRAPETLSFFRFTPKSPVDTVERDPSHERLRMLARQGAASNRTTRDKGMTAMRGFTLLETLTSLIIVAVMAAVLAPLAASLMDANRAGQTYDELAKIHTAIVGDPRKGTYGYIGDVGKFPDSLLDLVEKPASNPPGWNGPYLADARVEAGILYDVYGSPIECYYFRDNANSVADQFVLISRGADRSSTNTSATPNQCATYAGAPLPSAAGYVSSALNIDNVVYPRFTDNAALLSYQHLGTLAVNIMNFDQNALVSALVPGCPHLYNITVTSVPRGSNDTFTMPFNQGGDSVDLPEGLYDVRVTSQTALGSLWEEQVAITAGTTTSRQVNIFA